jgi:alkylation response protein AidB-like acyl-CoA dehydrogenase
VQRTLAHADPALTIALNMHLFSLGVMVEHWRREGDATWLLLEAIATQHRVVASGFAEPGLAGSLLRSSCTARRTSKDGYVIDGVKTPCSLARRADLICMQVQEADPPGDLLIALVPMGAPGIVVEPTWDWIGMRASESDTVRIDGCEIPNDLVFYRCAPGTSPNEITAAGAVWFCLTTATSYLGVLEQAITAAVDALNRQTVHHTGRARGQLSTYQVPLGEVVADVLESNAAVVGLARAMDERWCGAPDLLPAALAVKQRVAHATATGIEILSELMGAGALRRGAPVERLVRDAQAAKYHPPTPLVTRQILGRWMLGGELRIEVVDDASNAGGLAQ